MISPENRDRLSGRCSRPLSYRARGRTSMHRPAIRCDPAPRTPRRPAHRPASRTRRRPARPAGSAHSGPDCLRAGALHQLLAGQTRFVGKFRNRRGIGQVELISPRRRQRRGADSASGSRPASIAAITTPSASARIERPVRRLQVKLQAALVAPALQFDHAVTLPHRMALDQRQPAGLREQIDQRHRLVIDRQIVSTYEVPKGLMPDIGPRRLKREIIVDLARHAGSGNRIWRCSRSIPTGPPNQARSIDVAPALHRVRATGRRRIK